MGQSGLARQIVGFASNINAVNNLRRFRFIPTFMHFTDLMYLSSRIGTIKNFCAKKENVFLIPPGNLVFSH